MATSRNFGVLGVNSEIFLLSGSLAGFTIPFMREKIKRPICESNGFSFCFPFEQIAGSYI
nr:MAG TPA: hypothetical protein [Caudoviricetes sp.]